jgi:phage terminase large subunit-like protein
VAVAIRESVRTCPSCGEEFTDRRISGAPRTYCEICSPIRSRRHFTPTPEASVTTDGAFTLEHFREWARQLILDTGEPWALEPFQEAFAADLFTGIPEIWLLIPEGNGKTTLFAALALYHCEFRATGNVLVGASSRDQAQIMFLQADGLVRRSGLEGKFRLQEGTRRIRCDRMGSRIQILASDDRTGDGVIPTLCLLDELHRHRDLKLYRTWVGKLLKRGGQMAVISTAGEPGAEFEETRERIRQTSPELEREGSFVRAVGEKLILHEYAVPEGSDVTIMEVVKGANPLSTITLEQLQAKHDSPTMTPPHWRRFVCNLPTRSGSAAIQEAEWFGAETDERIPAGESISVGLDVAWKWDTTAIVPFWERDSEFRLLGPATILVPPRDGSSLDPNEIEAALLDIHEQNPIHTVVMDTNKGEQLAEWISQTFGCLVIDRPQTNAEAAEDFERFMEALRSGWLHHCGDPGLTRQVLNAVERLLPGGKSRFDRPAQTRVRNSLEQDRRVIDALTAAAMVHSFAGVPAESVWAASW